MIDSNSKIKDIYATPVGHDIISKLLMQLGMSDNAVTNPVIGNIKFKSLKKIMASKLGEDFYDSFLNLLNTPDSNPLTEDGYLPKEEKPWWKEAVFYQIYPRSFKDSNGDGVGDLKGIIEKLDYLKELGVDAIWLCPVYDSPNDDNGYDIRDYRKIMEEFGTMADFDVLLLELHARGMRLIMDLVANHTSDEHEWFRNALDNPDSKYHDYYIFRKNMDKEPNNWTSFFSQSAWNYYEKNDEYALHLFSKKQMDLNWENPEVRKEVADLVAWWLEKGVDGFRMDVISLISKTEGLPDGCKGIGEMMGIRGIEHYFYGPKLHKYLHELREASFDRYNAFSVGETPGVGREMGKLITADYRKELDMIFNFDALETPGHSRFDDYEYDLNFYKEYILDWYDHIDDHNQMSLFFENHDNPRMVSKVSKSGAYRTEIAKLLAVMQLTLKGTPFIYQGQELGLVNTAFKSMDEIKDVESINLYNKLLSEGKSEKEAFDTILAGSRDHARTPMRWNASKNAGFTDGTPWIGLDEDYKKWNVEIESSGKDSVLSFYKEILALRKTDAFGTMKIEFLDRKKKNLLHFLREGEEQGYRVVINLSSHNVRRPEGKGEVIISNIKSIDNDNLAPYEATVYKI